MIYLLDVSAILSLVSISHQFHPAVEAWVITLDAKRDLLATCAITELGVVRILSQNAKGNMTVGEAQFFLGRVKQESLVPFTFLSDNLGVDSLPAWVKTPSRRRPVISRHWPKKNGGILATFDTGIRGALVIPLL